MRGLVFVSSETLSHKSFSQNRSGARKMKNSLSSCAAFFLLADFLVHFLSLKKGSFGCCLGLFTLFFFA